MSTILSGKCGHCSGVLKYSDIDPMAITYQHTINRNERTVYACSEGCFDVLIDMLSNDKNNKVIHVGSKTTEQTYEDPFQ